MSNAILLATLDALCEHWHRQSLLPTTGATARAVALAQQHRVTLPTDFAAFYRRANGMAVTSTKDTDDEGFYFLTVEELRATTEDLRVYSGRGVHQVATTLTVFADYLRASWWYGFIPAASGTGYEIGMLPTRGVFKVITTSLATFLNLYLEDAQVLYDYPNEALFDSSEPRIKRLRRAKRCRSGKRLEWERSIFACSLTAIQCFSILLRKYTSGKESSGTSKRVKGPLFSNSWTCDSPFSKPARR